MFRFQKKPHDITIGSHSLTQVMAGLRTPFYLYDLVGLERQLQDIQSFLKQHPQLRVCYAIKANFEPEICKRMIHSGLGFDVVSGGEISHLKRLGAKSHSLYFSGVGKTTDEIDLAIVEKMGGLHIESLAELQIIRTRSKTLKQPTKVGIRWNPDVDVKTHRHLRTGDAEDKFGLETPQVLEALCVIQDSPGLSFSGLHVHVGSQILELKTFEAFYKRAKTFMSDLIQKGHRPEYLNVGGGIGIYYDERIGESPALLKKYLELLAKIFKDVPYTVITEPGRALVGIYGALISRVLYTKTGTQKNFLICDASMTELMRPVLYGARHPVWMIQQSRTRNTQKFELVSPICESGDVFAENFTCDYEPTAGDILAILGSGAYGACMANQYNLRPLPPAKFIT